MAPESRRSGAITLTDKVDLGACVLLLLTCTLAKLAWLQPVGPLIFFDELLYRQGAEALAVQGTYPSGQYPFLYPLLLAPAEALGLGYRGIFLINVLATSMLIPACWLLARAVGTRWGWPAAFAAALLPLQWVFPTQVMSENLFVPLFAWTVWYAIRAAMPSALPSVAYGVALASLFLVKYLALPAIPLVWIIWLLGMAARPLPWRSLLAPAVLSIAGMLAMVAAWVAYTHANGIGTAEAFGANVSGLNAGELMTPSAVAMWAIAYLCAIVLLAAPWLPRLLEGWAHLVGAPLQFLPASPLARLLLLCTLLIGGYWLICIQHSAGAINNYPVPQRVIVRYFMHLTPLLAVLGIALTLAPLRPWRPWIALPAAALSAIATWLAHQVLYADLVWNFPQWFATIPLYNSDTLGFIEPGMLWALIGLVLAGAFVGMHRAVAWVWVTILLVVLGASSMEVHQRATRVSSTRPLHAKTLAPLVIEAAREHGKVLVITELARETQQILRQALVFWGADPGTFRVIGTGQEAAAKADGVEVLRITTTPHAGTAVRYRVGNGTGYIYRERFNGMAVPERPSGSTRFVVEPASLCGGSPQTVTLSWDARASGADRVMVFVRTRDGEKPFAGGPPAGSRSTGTWARPGMSFRLRDSRSGHLLAEATVTRRSCG